MEPNITPVTSSLRSPGDLFRDAWVFFKINWKILVSIIAVPSAISLISQLFLVSNNPGLKVLSAILGIVAFIVLLAMKLALIDSVRQLSNNPASVLSIKGQYKFGFSLFWSLIFILIIEALAVGGALALLIIPGIILAVYLSFYTFALVIDSKKGFSALIESYNLVRNRWFKVFGRIIVIGIAAIVVYFIGTGIAWLINALFGFAAHSESAAFVAFILSTATSLVVGPFTIVYMYKLYESLKATRVVDTTHSNIKNLIIASMVVGVIAIIVAFALGLTVALFIAKSFINPGGIVPTGNTSIYNGPGINSPDYFPNGAPGADSSKVVPTE
jgi:hypothetical protein